MADLRPNATYPGVRQVLDCQYSVGWSTSPGRIALTIVPQDVSAIQGTGDLTFDDGLNPSVTIADCQVVDLVAPNGDAGPLTLTLLDGRWRWDFGEVWGRWNVHFDRSQTVPPLAQPLNPPANQPQPPPTPAPAEEQIREISRMVAPDLAKILLAAMKVKKYDLRGLDPKATPSVNWVAANPAAALQQLASDLGCVVAFNPSTLAVSIAKQGDGGPLPGGQTLVEAPELKARPRPSRIRCYGARDRVQMRIPLLAAGIDFDGAVKPLDKLSYRPVSGDWTGVFPPHFGGLPPAEKLSGKRTTLDAVALARRSVYLYYLPLMLDDPAVMPPGEAEPNSNPVTRELEKLITARPAQKELPFGVQRWPPYGVQIIHRGGRTAPPGIGRTWGNIRLLPVKNEVTTDDLGRYATAPAACYGRHSPPERCRVNGDVIQAYDQTTPETEVKVPFSIVDLGNDEQAVVFHQYVWALKSAGPDRGKAKPAEIVIECACEIAYKSLQYYRTPFDLKLNNVPPGTGVATIIREDVRFQRTAFYDAGNKFTNIGDNKTLAEKRANYYLSGEARKYELSAAGDVTYPGFQTIYPDGAIMQVTWSLSPPTTRASMNTEHALYLPSFKDRLREDNADLEANRRAKEQIEKAQAAEFNRGLPIL
jgi:hypothetical protein